MAQRITIDPITRIEGHLRIDAEVDNGQVTKAWSSGQMFRGLETILQGRDPRDAWLFTQRICGVCTTVHALASVRAVEKCTRYGDPNKCSVCQKYCNVHPCPAGSHCSLLCALGP